MSDAKEILAGLGQYRLFRNEDAEWEIHSKKDKARLGFNDFEARTMDLFVQGRMTTQKAVLRSKNFQDDGKGCGLTEADNEWWCIFPLEKINEVLPLFKWRKRRVMSEEQRAKAAERLKKMREQKEAKK